MQLIALSAFVTLAAVTSRFGILPAAFASPAPAATVAVIPIDPLPPIIACPLTELTRCCRVFSPLSESSAASALSTAGISITNTSEIIGVGCFPFPLDTEDESIIGIGICEPLCCPREIPLADATDGSTIAINCLPIGEPIPGPIRPITGPVLPIATPL